MLRFDQYDVDVRVSAPELLTIAFVVLKLCGVIDWLWLWMFPTMVQDADGYAFHWKRVGHHIYLVKIENLHA